MDDIIARIQRLEQKQNKLYSEFEIVTVGVALLVQEVTNLKNLARQPPHGPTPLS